MQFDAVADIYMAKRKYEILIACNINQLDIYNIIIDYLHKNHINKQMYQFLKILISYLILTFKQDFSKHDLSIIFLNMIVHL